MLFSQITFDGSFSKNACTALPPKLWWQYSVGGTGYTLFFSLLYPLLASLLHCLTLTFPQSAPDVRSLSSA